jgi:uncharacterized membrane protein
MTTTERRGLLDSLVQSLLTGPAADRLKKQAVEYATTRVTTGLTGGLGRKSDRGAEGSEGDDEERRPKAEVLKGVAEVAKKVVSGQSPAKVVTEVAKQGVLTRLKGGFGKLKEGIKKVFGGGSSGPKMTNIEEDLRIGIPIRVVYDQWSVYESFPSFMKGVESVNKKDDVESIWKVKVWIVRRSWTATVMEQVPDRYLKWTSEGAKGTTEGRVTFHPLADDLTQVLLAMEYYPKGVIERIGNIWRAGGRRTRLDLKHFRRFLMKRGEATGSWRGEIRDGKVVRQPDEITEGAEPREPEPGREPEEERRPEGERRPGEEGEQPEEQPEEAPSQPEPEREPEPEPARS